MLRSWEQRFPAVEWPDQKPARIQGWSEAMGAPHHSEALEIRAKSDRYGRWVVGENQKTTGFPGQSVHSKNGGLAPPPKNGEKSGKTHPTMVLPPSNDADSSP